MIKMIIGILTMLAGAVLVVVGFLLILTEVMFISPITLVVAKLLLNKGNDWYEDGEFKFTSSTESSDYRYVRPGSEDEIHSQSFLDKVFPRRVERRLDALRKDRRMRAEKP